VVTCEIKLFQPLISHVATCYLTVVTCEIKRWNYFTVISK